ncbi:hypothetical protein [Laspinema palackyanum]
MVVIPHEATNGYNDLLPRRSHQWVEKLDPIDAIACCYSSV